MRTYTIGDAAKIMGVAPSTLRYYDKEGLLPFVERDANGRRVFKEADFEWLANINCMKNAGAPIADIRRYAELCRQGDATLQERLQIFLDRKRIVQEQMEALNCLMETIDHKIWYYNKAIEAGTESVHTEKCYRMEALLK